MKKARMIFATGLVVIALLSAGEFASNVAAAPTVSERQNPALVIAKLPRAHAVASFGTIIETELLTLELTGFDSVNVRVKEGTHETVASFFDVFYEMTHGGEHFSGWTRTRSFFDVFFDTERQGQLTQTFGASVFEFCIVVWDFRFCIIIDFSAALSRDPGVGGVGGSTAGHSFFEIFVTLDDTRSGGRLLTHSMSSSYSNRVWAEADPAGSSEWMSQSASFFDVFTELSLDASPNGNAQVSSFFDVFFDVFNGGFGSPNVGHSKISGGGKNHAAYGLDEKTGHLMLRAQNMVAQKASVGALRNVATFEATNGGMWAGEAREGDTPLLGVSFFDITFRIGLPPSSYAAFTELQSELNLQYTTISNVLKTKHDVAKNIIQNLRA